jgi:hypothetical protein
MLTLGAELIDNVRRIRHLVLAPPIPVFDIGHSSIQLGAYVQDEIKLTGWLIANGGLRYDEYREFARVSPRAALIVMPSSNQSFKYLYGRAFRAPNGFEKNAFYFGEATRNLRPESIDTMSSCGSAANNWLRTSVSTCAVRADGLIPSQPTFDAIGTPSSTWGTCGPVVWSSRPRCGSAAVFRG